MSENDEQQWKRHVSDEASVIHAQQEAAGPDHRPVAGPGLYGDHGTNISVREAVLGERERCVRQARLCATESALRQIGAATARDREMAQAMADAIVTSIRSDDSPE